MGSSSTTKTEMPAWAQQASQEAIALAKKLGQVGYMPYYGPDVAAFTPMQQMGMQGAYDAAAAYGLAAPGGNAMAGMPQAQDFGGGMMGYSSGPLFEQARQEFEARNPAQARQYNQNFVPYGTAETNPNFQQQQGIPYIDPTTGETKYIQFPWGQSGIPSNFNFS